MAVVQAGSVSFVFALKFLALHTKNNSFANSKDPDETSHNEPFHQNLHCLLFCFDFY